MNIEKNYLKPTVDVLEIAIESAVLAYSPSKIDNEISIDEATKNSTGFSREF